MSLAGVEAFAVLVTDVSELKAAQNSLCLANERLEARVRERTLELAKANEVLRGVISGREKLEESLRASEQEFRAIFESAGAGKVQVDAKTGKFLRVNRKMCEITGYSAEDLIGRQVADITHPEDREGDAAGVKQLVSGELQDTRWRSVIFISRVTWFGPRSRPLYSVMARESLYGSTRSSRTSRRASGQRRP